MLLDPKIAPRRDTFPSGATIGEMIPGPLGPTDQRERMGQESLDYRGPLVSGRIREPSTLEAHALR
jgi:hypothetical protein